MPSTTTYQLYQYVPSLPAAAVAVCIFALLTTAHCFRVTKTKMRFCIPFTVGGLFETIGYIGRVLGHPNPQALSPYIMQSVLILVAPALFAATIYMTLGRLIRAMHAEAYSIIRVTWLTRTFVIGDVLSFFIQGGGSGIMATGNGDKMKLGENIILGGLFLQIVMFGLFVIATVIFHARMRKYPTPRTSNPELRWQKMLLVLYAVSATIMVRNIVRVVEYIGGRTGPLLSVEWPIYVFDAILMASTMVVFSLGYPTMIRPEAADLENTEMPSVQSVDGSIGLKENRYSRFRHAV